MIKVVEMARANTTALTIHDRARQQSFRDKPRFGGTAIAHY